MRHMVANEGGNVRKTKPGIVMLVAAALAGAATATGTFTTSAQAVGPVCGAHASPRAVDALSAALKASAGPAANDTVGDQVAQVLSKVQRDGDQLNSDTTTVSGLPYGLAAGVIGSIGTVDTGFTVVVDTRKVSPAAYTAKLAGQLPASASGAVTVESSCVSADALASAWKKLEARDWSSTATKATYSYTLDPASEKIQVNLDQSSAAEASAIKNIAPDLINVSLTTMSRLRK
jgi:hypothetical protein